MDLFLTEQQQMLTRSAHDFLAGHCAKVHVRRMEEDDQGYSPELWHQMTKLGWMGLVFPMDYGGSELGFFNLVLLLEEMGRACLPGPFLTSRIFVWAGHKTKETSSLI